MHFKNLTNQEVRDRLKFHYLYRGEVHPMACGIVGSVMYNDYRDGSDIDLRGIFIWNTKELLKVKGPSYTRLEYNTEKKEGIHVEFVGYELQRFCQMLLKGNPNSYDQLYSPVQWERESKHIEDLRVIAKRLLTSKVYHPFHGIAKTKWERLCKRRLQNDMPSEPKDWILVLRNLNRGHAILKGKAWEKSFDIDYDYKKELEELRLAHDVVSLDMTKVLTIEVEDRFNKLKLASENNRVQAKVPKKNLTELDEWLLKIRLETLEKPNPTWGR